MSVKVIMWQGLYFFKEFIATGIISKEYSKLYSTLSDCKKEGDYSDFVDFDEESVVPMIRKTQEFIKVIKDKI